MSGTTKQFRIPIPADFPTSHMVDFEKLIGSDVLGNAGTLVLGQVQSAALERTENEDGTELAAVHIGIRSTLRYNIEAETLPFGMELEPAGEAPANPGEVRKWRISNVLRSTA